MSREPTRYVTLDPAEVDLGDELPPIRVEVTRAMVVASAAATGTFFDGHIDRDYARDQQGRRDIYLATGPILGLADRGVGEWAGPRAFVRHRTARMRASICAGDTIDITGAVTGVDQAPLGRVVLEPVAVLTVELAITNQDDEVCAAVTTVVEIPRRGEGAVP